ncbi:MAG: iron chelate uptake ABC transporter family permease subunit [Thermoplasmata archaeon]|nr:MAG: iron chelate uptake ABC transporter family permease subunit [Thermoplasmata archaeon]
MNYKRKWIITIVSLIILLIFSIAGCTSVGPVYIPFTDVFKIILSRLFFFHSYIETDYEEAWYIIIWDIRLPQVILGVLVGVALSCAGTTMQGLFKNPLADPFIIGVSAGAALGAAVAVTIGESYFSVDTFFLAPLLSFISALLSVYLVYNIARTQGRISVNNLLLAGIAVNFFLSALTSLLIYIYITDARSVMHWLIGSLGASSWNDIKLVAPIIIIGIAVLMVYSKDLNIMLLGEETAINLGVNVERVKKIMLFFATLITAAAVSVSGIIGFVGLMIPHIMRLIVGPDHRILLPASALAGGIFLIWCDAIARIAIPPAQIPVALITAIIGGPFFIYLLWRRKYKTGGG